MALRAAVLNSPGPDYEGSLIRSIGRSKCAPQGICIVNSAGQALAWSEMFQNGKALAEFLTRGLERYKQNPDGARSISTKRYVRYPASRLADFVEEPRRLPTSTVAAAGARQPDRLVINVVGRALDRRGQLLSDTLHQESYIEHKFDLPPDALRYIHEIAASRPGTPVPLPEPLAKAFISQAFLGQLDMQPFHGDPGASDDLKRCTLSARQRNDGVVELSGESDVSVSCPSRPDGASYGNQVTLSWNGLATFDGDRRAKLYLIGRGSQKAYWSSPEHRVPGACTKLDRDAALASLPAGHPFKLDSAVVFGFTAEGNSR